MITLLRVSVELWECGHMVDSAFQARLRQMRADMVQRTAGMLTAAEAGAIKTLIALQAEGMPPPVTKET